MSKQPIILLLASFQSFAQQQTPEEKHKRIMLQKKVEGMCVSAKDIFELYNGNEGEVEPKCSISKEELTGVLNSEFSFLKNNPDLKRRQLAGQKSL